MAQQFHVIFRRQKFAVRLWAREDDATFLVALLCPQQLGGILFTKAIRLFLIRQRVIGGVVAKALQLKYKILLVIIQYDAF